MQKTKLEIIDETVAFYSENVSRRSFTIPGVFKTLESCVYWNEKNGNVCAVGRCASEEGLKTLHDLYEGVGIEGVADIFPVDNILKEEYKGHSVDFWNAIQFLHDRSSYWDENGLSEMGKEYVKNLIEEYGN